MGKYRDYDIQYKLLINLINNLIPINKMQVHNYRILDQIGAGTFGTTFKGIRISDGKEVAIKTIDINKSQQLGASIRAINDEIETLKELATGCHRYIACYYESFMDNLNGVQTMFIISELVKGGSLTKFIQEYGGTMTPNFLWPIMNQLILGVKYIHDQGWAHRDLKPDNILITEDLEIKLIDFGLGCSEECRIYNCTNTCKGAGGTLWYLPPEFFNGTRVDSLQASQAHDIWSLTMVMFELVNGLYKFPFNVIANNKELPAEQIAENIVAAPQISSNYRNDDGRTNKFLDSLVEPDWRLRPTINDILIEMIQDVLSRVF